MIQRNAIAAIALTVALAPIAGTAVAQQSNAPSSAVAATPKALPVADAVAVPKASPSANASSSQSKAMRAVPQARPLVVTVDLLSGTKISGTLTDANSLEIRTSFGAANMPLSEVSGIRFATADDPTTTVAMHNGDSITGATDVKIVTVETEWGTATINGQSVQSILFVPNVTWNSLAGLNGKRWSLVTVKKDPPKQPAAAAPVAPTNPNTTTTYPGRRTTTYPYRGR